MEENFKDLEIISYPNQGHYSGWVKMREGEDIWTTQICKKLKDISTEPFFFRIYPLKKNQLPAEFRNERTFWDPDIICNRFTLDGHEIGNRGKVCFE